MLLVEDQVLIAMDAEDYLRANGAVLDVNLGDHSSVLAAKHLASLGVPFVFATGYGDSSMVPETMRAVPVVRKPYSETVLLAALTNALASKGK